MFFALRMDKETFLRLQYLRMINSDEFVVELWRSSCERFLSDMWDRTPATPGRRFLEPIDAILGFSPDNVEWHFAKIKERRKKAQSLKLKQTTIKVRQTKAERKAHEAALAEERREAKRKAIADQFRNWKNGSLVRRS